MNRRSILGLLLIFVGTLAGLANVGYLDGNYMLLAIAGCLIAAYFYFGGVRSDANLGFLIPGCILTAVSLYAILDNAGFLRNADPAIFLIMLGGAFLAVMFIHTLHGEDKDWGARYWPIFPGGILTGIGSIAVLRLDRILIFSPYVAGLIMPLIMLALGVVLLVTSKRTPPGTGGR